MFPRSNYLITSEAWRDDNRAGLWQHREEGGINSHLPMKRMGPETEKSRGSNASMVFRNISKKNRECLTGGREVAK